MATNLVSSVMQCLTPDLVAKIARTIGIDPELAQKVVAAAVPAILASFGGLAAKPAGAQQLSNTLEQQHPDMLAHITDAIGGSDQRAIADTGSGLLSSLLGGGGLNALVSAVSAHAGIDQSSGKSILGLLAPMVVGALGQQQRSGGLDANGIADLLSSQKDQIAAAMPSGLANMLGARGMLDAVDGSLRRGADSAAATAGSAAAAAGRMAGAASDTAGRMAGATSDTAGRMAGAASNLAGRTARATSDGTGRVATAASDEIANTRDVAYAAKRKSDTPTWLLWILGIIILGGGGWYLLGDRGQQQLAEQTRGLINSVSPEVANKFLAPNAADLSADLKSSVDNVRATLQGINDPSTARAALPKLKEATEKLDKINNLAAQLPPGSRKELAAMLGSSMPALNQLCDRVLSSPHIGVMAKPTIDALRAQLQSLSRA
jgi:Bacterial protein of unknown function (DUF937)